MAGFIREITTSAARALALGMNRELGALWAIGGQERSQIGKSGVAMIGHQSGDAIDAPAVAAGTDQGQRGDDQVREVTAP